MTTQAVWLFLAMAFLAGVLMSTQAGINGLLAKELSNVLVATTISFIVGLCALLILLMIQRDTFHFSSLKQLQWWHWIGGLMGAYLVFSAAFVAPRIGALLFMALVLAGQLSSALVLDHYGWLGFKESAISWGKIAGLVLIFTGVWLIRRG